MYFAQTHNRHPKNKIACSVVTTDGDVMEGSLFTSGDQRVKDLLNGENQFIPLEGFDGTIHLLNRHAIARVTPHDNTTSIRR